jgi:hypothetical protein
VGVVGKLRKGDGGVSGDSIGEFKELMLASSWSRNKF